MPFPKTETELTEQGYRYDNKSLCRGCDATIEWWITPKGAHMPLDPGTKEPHWSTCPNAARFKKARK